jgi:hypothetical protein
MAFWLAIVTLVAAAAALSPEAAVPRATLVTWFSNHQTLVLIASSAGIFAVTRYVSHTLER